MSLSFLQKLHFKLFKSDNASSLAVFRIGFGIVLLVETYLYLFKGKIDSRLLNENRFSYWPFDFVQPLGELGMDVLFYGLAVLSFFIIIGLLFRLSIILFFLLYTYVFLIDGAYYLNHNYLICLLSFIMIFIPMSRIWAVDAFIDRKKKTQTVSSWMIWVLRFTIALPYFFGGIAKLNSDWLHGYPMKNWLKSETINFPIPAIEKMFGVESIAMFMSYSGLLLDLLIVLALLFKRTRTIAFILIVCFHLLNHTMFNIDIFPWFMIVATTIFFAPNWPQKLLYKISNTEVEKTTTTNYSNTFTVKQKAITLLLGCWVVFHLLFPLRHYVIPGNVHWTHEGQRFSWQMMLNHKLTRTAFRAIDIQTGQEYNIQPLDYLNTFQKIRMAERPHWVWRFCQIVKQDFKNNGIDVAVFAYVECSLNGRVYQPMIDTNINLAAEPRNLFGNASWIIPLETPLKNQLQP